MSWRALIGDDLAEVSKLADRCLAVDGGLPLVTTPAFLGRRFAAERGFAGCHRYRGHAGRRRCGPPTGSQRLGFATIGRRARLEPAG
ncbi:hypothetical protein GCM10027290_17010 [Micromonospora sonneratiae]